MRLNEFTRPPNRQAAEKLLLSKGFVKLSYGAFSDVYHKADEPFVLKLFANIDKAYVAFVDWCKAHAASPHVPRFRSGIIRVTDRYSAIRMERLYRLTAQERIMTYAMAGYVRGLTTGYAPEVRDARAKLPEDMTRLLDDLVDFLKHQTGLSDDLKPENIMRRANGDIVLVDPISGEY